MHPALLLRNIRLLDPRAGRDEAGDLLIVEGRLAAPDQRLPAGTRILDGRGLAVAPGLVDVHVHFRDPGLPAAEDQRSGSAAAARGGFTDVVTMPNTHPACDTPAAVARQLDPALPVRIHPSACLTAGRHGAAVADLEALAAAGAAAFTDDGSTVADDAVMSAAMLRAGRLGRPVMDHAIDPALAAGGMIRAGSLATRLGLPVLPAEAEVAAVTRDIRLARQAGCRLHLQHLSCAGSVDAVRAARAAGLPVTGEASPHHLAFSVEDIPGDDGNFRMNPPLGTPDDVRALRAGVADGTLTILATDHAPHTPESKRNGYRTAPFGVIGLETAVGATYDVLVRDLGLTPLQWLAAWTCAPAALLGLPAPSLTVGAAADLALLALDAPWTVNPATFASRSRNCPFAGRTLHARAVAALRDGAFTWIDPAVQSRLGNG